jgi:hypothetical protein
MAGEFYADIALIRNSKKDYLVTNKYGYPAIPLKSFNIHFVNNEGIFGANNGISAEPNMRFAYARYNGYPVRYRIINISRKATVSLKETIHRAITNYKQNLKEIQKYKEANNKILKQYGVIK